jgi:hypothetical protein
MKLLKIKSGGNIRIIKPYDKTAVIDGGGSINTSTALVIKKDGQLIKYRTGKWLYPPTNAYIEVSNLSIKQLSSKNLRVKNGFSTCQYPDVTLSAGMAHIPEVTNTYNLFVNINNNHLYLLNKDAQSENGSINYGAILIDLGICPVTINPSYYISGGGVSINYIKNTYAGIILLGGTYYIAISHRVDSMRYLYLFRSTGGQLSLQYSEGLTINSTNQKELTNAAVGITLSGDKLRLVAYMEPTSTTSCTYYIPNTSTGWTKYTLSNRIVHPGISSDLNDIKGIGVTENYIVVVQRAWIYASGVSTYYLDLVYYSLNTGQYAKAVAFNMGSIEFVLYFYSTAQIWGAFKISSNYTRSDGSRSMCYIVKDSGGTVTDNPNISEAEKIHNYVLLSDYYTLITGTKTTNGYFYGYSLSSRLSIMTKTKLFIYVQSIEASLTDGFTHVIILNLSTGRFSEVTPLIKNFIIPLGTALTLYHRSVAQYSMRYTVWGSDPVWTGDVIIMPSGNSGKIGYSYDGITFYESSLSVDTIGLGNSFLVEAKSSGSSILVSKITMNGWDED